jgi:hypothetical protein
MRIRHQALFQQELPQVAKRFGSYPMLWSERLS